MMIKFNIAYVMLQYAYCKSEIILHKKNGLNVTPTCSNDVAYVKFIGVIPNTQEKNGKKAKLQELAI